MTTQELNKIEENLICPKCGSSNIDLYFENSDCENVGLEYVHPEMMNEENTDNGISHCCFCRDCGHDDVRDYFDEEIIRQTEKWLKDRRDKQTITEISKP